MMYSRITTGDAYSASDTSFWDFVREETITDASIALGVAQLVYDTSSIKVFILAATPSSGPGPGHFAFILDARSVLYWM